MFISLKGKMIELQSLLDEDAEEGVSMNMDPILTLGLSAFVFGGLLLIILSFIYHCLLATLECIDNVVTRFPDSKSHPNPSTVEDI